LSPFFLFLSVVHNFRGSGADVIVVDEAAFVSDNHPTFLTEEVQPLRQKKGNIMITISTRSPVPTNSFNVAIEGGGVTEGTLALDVNMKCKVVTCAGPLPGGYWCEHIQPEFPSYFLTDAKFEKLIAEMKTPQQFEREILGTAPLPTEGDPVFDVAAVDRLLASPPVRAIPFAEGPVTLVVGVDAGAGQRKSTAFVALTVTEFPQEQRTQYVIVGLETASTRTPATQNEAVLSFVTRAVTAALKERTLLYGTAPDPDVNGLRLIVAFESNYGHGGTVPYMLLEAAAADPECHAIPSRVFCLDGDARGLYTGTRALAADDRRGVLTGKALKEQQSESLDAILCAGALSYGRWIATGGSVIQSDPPALTRGHARYAAKTTDYENRKRVDYRSVTEDIIGLNEELLGFRFIPNTAGTSGRLTGKISGGQDDRVLSLFMALYAASARSMPVPRRR